MKKIAIIAKTGGAKNFLKHLLSPPGTNLHFPEVNEYRASVNPNAMFWRDGHFQSSNRYPASRFIQEYHPVNEDGFFLYTLEVIKDRKVYYVDISDEETHNYVMRMGYLKVRLLRSYFNIKTIVDAYEDKTFDRVPVKRFRSYCRFIKENKLEINPMSQWGMKAFHMIQDGQYTVEKIRSIIIHELDKITFFDEDKMPDGLDIEYINYKEFFLEGKPSGTVFDNYRDEVNKYHQRNIDFLKRVNESWGYDFIKGISDYNN